ncbi:MAG: FtsX-like permease family protein [Deltaproteobacteria bacterium]|nr:FtsX-like permease family protein [Deltaproteobacteria bacterium]
MLFVSFLAVTLGNAVLVSVLSIMNGFQKEIRLLLLHNKPHMTVSLSDKNLDSVEAALKNISNLSRYSVAFQVPALVSGPLSSTGVIVRGDKSQKGLAVNRNLAYNLGVREGDTVRIMTPSTTLSPFGALPRTFNTQVTALLEGASYDDYLVFMNFEEGKKLFNPRVFMLEIFLKKPDEVTESKSLLEAELTKIGSSGFVQTWIELNEPLWNALQLEKTAYFIVLTLIIIVASFSILSALVLFVLEKRKELAIFVSLGASTKNLTQIFFRLGLFIGLFGTISGLFLGFLLCLGLDYYGFPLDERVFGISRLPIDFNIMSYLLVGFVSLMICICAVIYPIRRVSKLNSTALLRE